MRSRLSTVGLSLGLVLGLGVANLTAQDWRDVTSFRNVSGERELQVHVRYGAGELLIRRGSPGELYRVALRYDADIFDPVTHYDDGRLEVGIEGGDRGIRIRNTEAGELRLQLSPDVPLELDLEFGAGEADLELGGLRLLNLDLETGASDTEIRFSDPNPVECDRLDVTMGAAAFSARGLANANCQRIRVEGGVGDLTLDFDGTWNRDIEADLTMALGSVTLVIPRDVGVRVDKNTFLTDFDRSGFYKRDDVFYSDSWEGAERRLDIQVEGAFGSVNVRWVAPLAGTTP